MRRFKNDNGILVLLQCAKRLCKLPYQAVHIRIKNILLKAKHAKNFIDPLELIFF